jgi:hypothetical protein
MTLSIKGLFAALSIVTLSIKGIGDTQHSMLRINMSVIILSVIILSFIIPSVIMLNVVMLNDELFKLLC